MTGVAWKPTHVTAALRAKFIAEGADPADFVTEFEDWKDQWPKYEDDFLLFGKDGSYVRARVHGKPYILRHVHLQPLHGKHRSTWRWLFNNYKRRTSDRHLIYVTCQAHGTLLIHILNAPTAHAVAKQKTPQDRAVMRLFCTIAENFIDYGEVP